MFTTRSPFCGYNTAQFVELWGEDLVFYSNNIDSDGLRKWPYNHWLTNKAYLSDITVTNIFPSFTHKMVAKNSWHRHGTKLRHCHPTYRSQTMRRTKLRFTTKGARCSMRRFVVDGNFGPSNFTWRSLGFRRYFCLNKPNYIKSQWAGRRLSHAGRLLPVCRALLAPSPEARSGRLDSTPGPV